MKQLIAICGLDCEKCDSYIATKNNDQALLWGFCAGLLWDTLARMGAK